MLVSPGAAVLGFIDDLASGAVVIVMIVLERGDKCLQLPKDEFWVFYRQSKGSRVAVFNQEERIYPSLCENIGQLPICITCQPTSDSWMLATLGMSNFVYISLIIMLGASKKT